MFIQQLVAPASIETAHWFICGENEVVFRKGGPLPSTDEVRGLGLEVHSAQMLGLLDGVPCLAIAAPQESQLDPNFELVGLRALWSRLDETFFGIAGRANQLVHFAQTHRFCGRCGTQTIAGEKERAFRCPQCALTAYPRISPAIITLVRKGDEALLANSGRFPIPFFSTLAGFSEVGESLEQTLVREVREEVGVNVGNVRYFGSQPWPFPHSLMIGFTATWESGDIVVDGEEIKEARFFKASELPRIPPKISIARQLIDAWVREVTGHDAPG